MFLRFIGSVWLASGVFLFIKPQTLKTWLSVHNIIYIRRMLFNITIVIGAWLITGGMLSPKGWYATFLMTLGIIAAAECIFFLKSKIVDDLVAWAKEQPLGLFRFEACFRIIIALIILSGA